MTAYFPGCSSGSTALELNVGLLSSSEVYLLTISSKAVLAFSSNSIKAVGLELSATDALAVVTPFSGHTETLTVFPDVEFLSSICTLIFRLID